MKKINFKIFVASLCLTISFTSCKQKPERISSFHPMNNFSFSDTLRMEADLECAVLQGIEIPTIRQTESGYFITKFSFEPEAEKSYYYKIYYQNESYKFKEKDSLSHENFYGSWENVSVGFKPLRLIDGVCTDSIRIVGNPRDEKRYYGEAQLEKEQLSERITKMIAQINSIPDWRKAIEEKAVKNNISVEDALYSDALWTIKRKVKEQEENHRWKRNPRMGCYKFMLVVVEEACLKKLPEYVVDISKTDENGKFVNPFSFFNKKKIENAWVNISDDVLKIRASLKPSEGIYVDPFSAGAYSANNEYFSVSCNGDEQARQHAHFAQFFHHIHKGYSLNNIPDVRDVVGENPYTRAEFLAGKEKYDSTQLIRDHTYNPTCPCKNLSLERDGVVLMNEGNKDKEHPQKQNIGIISRIGFSYGKFRGKIKFPELLNDEYVWNGLTNAFWLFCQSSEEWGMRRESKTGYIPKDLDGPESLNQREKRNHYSEIDIEIVKAAPGWWLHKIEKEGDGFDNGDVAFTCTNWDLAAQDPKRFFSGQKKHSYGKDKFTLIRWTEAYKALSSKYMISDDELFKPDFYYYEIEWRPQEIIWRVGPAPDQMKVVGYMNDKVTMIPDNQMLCIITQEFHYGDWWPKQPYHQDFVPYPKNDIKGVVYEVVVE